MTSKIRWGYAGSNLTLAERGIRTNRTCRQVNWGQAVELARANIEDLMKTIQWNEKHGIRFYRISSEILPHISNHRIKSKKTPAGLLYDIGQFQPMLRQIGDYVKKHGHRITFHPGLFTIMNTPHPHIWDSVKRELDWHARFLDQCGLGPESVVILHGGGVYGNMPEAKRRWISRYNSLPPRIKRRVVIENDECCFSIEDVLDIANRIKPYKSWGVTIRAIPVVFDLFHHHCMQTIRTRKNHPLLGEPEHYMPIVAKTWITRPKIHISNQRRGHRLGKHSYYITQIPRWITNWEIDVMLEAKGKERALKRVEKNLSKLLTDRPIVKK
jgi:UV DNA damage endonuclease